MSYSLLIPWIGMWSSGKVPPPGRPEIYFYVNPVPFEVAME
jgi:hypothetical protein